MLRDYEELPTDELFARIRRAKEQLGDDLIILGHHYQRDDVLQFADFRGDSLELAQIAAQQHRARYIIFCGVDFMAETAAVLCAPDQTVILPEAEAFCPMAMMSTGDEANQAWEMLSDLWGGDLLPITYQNSLAEVKALCGRKGGAVCTSANAEPIFRWALAQKEHLLFFPDEHLGRNTALAIGIPEEKIALWDPADPKMSLKRAPGAKVVIWKGMCYVHTRFTVAHIHEMRKRHRDIMIIVHPECPAEVVRAADQSGSTSTIIRVVAAAAPGAKIAIGTEINLVQRLADKYPDKTIGPLALSLCRTMHLTTPQHLYAVLDDLTAGRTVDRVTVSPEIARWARIALERMLTVK